jgi:cytochrome c biogenesis protein CcdA
MSLLIITFIAGILSSLAPCVLPLIPVIIGGTLTEAKNKYKPFIITGSTQGKYSVDRRAA